jgi:NADH-quinone oxidoreductase subunit G
MIVRTMAPKAVEARKNVIEFLLANHPLDCPICDRAGECVLQDNSMQNGLMKSRFAPTKVHKPKVVDIGPHVVLDAERCIMCSRCVRFTDEVSKSHELGIFGRGNKEEIGLAPGKRLDNPYSGNVVDLCPVGALTAKEFRFQSRAWFLKKTESVCPSCARGCNITVETNTNVINKVGQRRVYRFMPRHHEDVNGHWMCDEGRYRFPFVDEHRQTVPMVRRDGALVKASWEEALSAAKSALGAADPKRVGILLSRGSTMEDLFLAKEWIDTWMKGADVAVDAPAGRLPTEDDFLVCRDKWANTAGARVLGLDGTGEDWVALMARAEKSELDVLIVVDHDLDRLMQLATVESALNRVKHVIVIAQHETTTTHRASIVLPVAMFAERDGTWINVDGRLQRFHQALDPLGSAVPEWKVWKELLGRFGTPMLYNHEAAVFGVLAGSNEAFKGITWDAIGNQGVVVKAAVPRKPVAV